MNPISLMLMSFSFWNERPLPVALKRVSHPCPFAREDVIIELWNSQACLAVLHSSVFPSSLSIFFFSASIYLFTWLCFNDMTWKQPLLGKSALGGRKLES